MEAIRGRDISMIFQDPMTSLNPVLTVGEQIMEVIENHNTSPVYYPHLDVYKRQHPSLCGQCALEGDSLGRTVVYGLVRGKGAGTVVLLSLIHILTYFNRVLQTYTSWRRVL